MREIHKKIALCATAVACSAVLSVSVCGCRDTDVLKHINHTQSASVVDTKTDLRYLISNPNAQKTSESVPSVEVDRNAKVTAEKQNIVVYSSKPNSDRYLAKHSVFSLDPDFKGLEASDGVRLTKGKKDEPKLEHERVEELEGENDKSKSKGTGTSGDSGDSKNGKGNADKSGEDSSKLGKDKDTDEGEGANKEGDTEVSTTDTTSKYSEPPKVSGIAAFGQAAVIVQMVGGKGALIAADKKLLSSDFSKVFSDEGASKITVGWSGDGTDYKIDTNAIIKSGAQVILVDSGDYQKKLSEKERKALEEAKVSFVVIPKLSNSTYIKQAVITVGNMLSEADDIGNAGKTKKIASDYVAFHDKVVSSCVSANGGKLAGSKIYENKNKQRYSFNDAAKYTLLVDKYDKTASFKGTFAGKWTPTTNGVGICTYGFGSSPTSYYIQAGGLINNAADRGTASDTSSIVAWQFSNNSMSFKKKAFNYDSDGELAKCDDIVGSAWDQVLFTTDIDEDGNGVGSSFGSELFPTLIAGTQDIKKRIINNSKDENGAYHPYDKEVVPGGGAFGKMINSSICYSSIGVDGKNSGENIFESSQIDDDSVFVNPAGLFSSWMTGSVESFLESAWVNDVVAANDNIVDVKEQVAEFYKTFYRYNLSGSEVSDILDGE